LVEIKNYGYVKKILEMQGLKCNTTAKSITPVQITRISEVSAKTHDDYRSPSEVFRTLSKFQSGFRR